MTGAIGKCVGMESNFQVVELIALPNGDCDQAVPPYGG